MDLWLSIALIIGTIAIYMVSIEIYTALFSITGLTVQKSRFQVVSLFTNAGFTTIESEIITINRRRKSIATFCMINGNLFTCLIIGLITNMMLNLNSGEQLESSKLIFTISLIVLALCLILRTPVINKYEQKFLEKIARIVFRTPEKQNIVTILDNYGKDVIAEVLINTMPEPLRHRDLKEIGLKKNFDCTILMIKRKNRMIEVSASSVLEVKDRVVLFGNSQEIKKLFNIDFVEEKEEKNKNSIEVIDTFEDRVMAELELKSVPITLENKTLVESKLKDEYDIIVILVKRDSKSIDVNKDTKLYPNDTVIVYGKYKVIKDLFLIS
ncbi:MAG: TrkA C-terminal domain-containing protein [Bacilli bacterium]|nr:TrkA C-terminal domain-containing protein [Bacilli bacterium]